MHKILKLSVSVSDESSSDTDLGDEDLVLSFQQEITDTVDLLKPFDATKNPKRRKRKDKPGPNKQNNEKIGKEGTTVMDIEKD